AGRRDYLDDLVVAVAPRYAGVRSDYERVLRQRNALLRAGIRTADDATTLEVFDGQLAHAGAELAGGPTRLLDRLEPRLRAAYAELAGDDQVVTAAYEAAWWTEEGDDGREGDADATAARERALLRALQERRRAELDRRVTLAGPHRDEWRLQIGALD